MSEQVREPRLGRPDADPYDGGFSCITANSCPFLWLGPEREARTTISLGALMKVAVVGLGYVGMVTAACLASHGHDVWGIDVDPAKVDAVCRGRSPVAEPGLDELVAQTVAGGTLHASTSYLSALDEVGVSLVCVGTPSTARGAADLSYLRRAVDDVVEALRLAAPPPSGHHSVIIRSTVPPGTVEEVVAPALTRGLAGTEIAAGAAMCPEFLREGSGVADFLGSLCVIVGTSDPRAAETATGLFSFLGQPTRIVDVRVAEALKYASNAFHATKVSFANEMSRLLRLLGVDSREVMSLFCEDRVLNISPAYLRPGFAFGGSCLPKDLRSLLHLARTNSADLPMLAGALATNELVISDVVNRVVASDGHSVALFGLSFKTDTDDLRESPNVELAERLIGKGFDVRIYDPVVNPARLIGSNRRHIQSRLPHLRRLLKREPGAALNGADVAVVSSTDPAVRAALLAAPPPRLLDLSGRLGHEVESLPGYEGVGW
jgi:GDP-mannose 6-dehydrogenase